MIFKWSELEKGKSYYLTQDKKESGTFVQNLRSVSFFKPDMPTKFLVDTQEDIDNGEAYPETLGLLGIAIYGNETYEEKKI